MIPDVDFLNPSPTFPAKLNFSFRSNDLSTDLLFYILEKLYLIKHKKV